MIGAITCRQCAQALTERTHPNAVFDERMHAHFCDRECLRDWLGDHIDEWLGYYRELYVVSVW